MSRELGACEAIIFKIATNIDGSVRLTLDLNPDSLDLVKALMDLKMSDEPLIKVGFAAD